MTAHRREAVTVDWNALLVQARLVARDAEVQRTGRRQQQPAAHALHVDIAQLPLATLAHV